MKPGAKDENLLSSSEWVEKCNSLADSAYEVAEDSIYWRNFWATVHLDPHWFPTAEEEALPALIRDRIRRFAVPVDAPSATAMVAALHGGEREVHEGKDSYLGNIKDPLMDGWAGDAATNFEIYIGDVMAAVEKQSDVFNALALVANTHSELIQKMQEELTGVVNDGMAALNDHAMTPGKIGELVIGALSGARAVENAGEIFDKALGAMQAGQVSAGLYGGSEDAMQIMRTFALQLRLLYEATEATAAGVAAGFDAVASEIDDSLALIQPDEPKMISPKRTFHPDDFGLPDTPEFRRGKADISSEPLVSQKG